MGHTDHTILSEMGFQKNKQEGNGPNTRKVSGNTKTELRGMIKSNGFLLYMGSTLPLTSSEIVV